MVDMVEIDPDETWDEDLALADTKLRALRTAIVENHDREHEGVIQWCSHPLCQTYEEHR
jgi:hypothetical protein